MGSRSSPRATCTARYVPSRLRRCRTRTLILPAPRSGARASARVSKSRPSCAAPIAAPETVLRICLLAAQARCATRAALRAARSSSAAFARVSSSSSRRSSSRSPVSVDEIASSLSSPPRERNSRRRGAKVLSAASAWPSRAPREELVPLASCDLSPPKDTARSRFLPSRSFRLGRSVLRPRGAGLSPLAAKGDAARAARAATPNTDRIASAAAASAARAEARTSSRDASLGRRRARWITP